MKRVMQKIYIPVRFCPYRGLCPPKLELLSFFRTYCSKIRLLHLLLNVSNFLLNGTLKPYLRYASLWVPEDMICSFLRFLILNQKAVDFTLFIDLYLCNAVQRDYVNKCLKVAMAGAVAKFQNKAATGPDGTEQHKEFIGRMATNCGENRYQISYFRS